MPRRIFSSCRSCVLAAPEDGGKGGCLRRERYPELRLLPFHDCGLYRRRPTPRAPREEPQQEGLF